MSIIKQCVGIDVSQKQIDVTFGTYSVDQTIHLKETKRFKNTAQVFPIFLKWVTKRADPQIALFFTMEATGVYHERLASFLVDNGQQVNVVLPNRASNYAKTMEVKTVTDKEASKTLTRMGLERKLPLWDRPDPVYNQLKQFTREREQLQKLKTVVSNQLHASQTSAFKEINKGATRLLKLVGEQIKAIEKQLKEYIKGIPKLQEEITFMTSIKGVGVVTAATILGETNGFKGIENKRQLVSYAGMDVIRKDSGTSVTSKPRMSKRGNKHIRRALHFPALTAIKHNKQYKHNYIRIVQASGIKMKAAVAIQRKLLILMYTVWKKKQLFDPDFEAKKIGQLMLP